MGKVKSTNPNIQEIAAEANVSTATVSRVFNKHPYVSEDTRCKVMAAAQKFGYAPSVVSSKYLFGILTGDVNGYLFSPYTNNIAHCISQTISEAGYNVQLFSRKQFPYILKKTFGGVVVFQKQDAQFFKDKGIPVVLVNNPTEGFYNVYTDHQESLRIAVEYLHSLKHKKIAFIASTPQTWGTAERIKGYKDSLAELNLDFDENLLCYVKNPAQEMIPTIKNLIDNVKPTAIIAEGEGRGVLIDYALKSLNIRVPNDISLITFENTETSKFMYPQHTTVCQDFEELGKGAANLLIELATNHRKNLKLPMMNVYHNHLIERESCAIY